MIECLQYLDFPVIWHHVGDGVLRNELTELTSKLNVTDKFIFEGLIDSTKILDYYTDRNIDLFVNVSESEGVPFSIMESFSVGIPVIATDVGGTSEIVDESVGGLLKEELTAQDLAAKITAFNNLTPQAKQNKRANAYGRYENMCNAKKLATELAEYLVA